MKLPEIEWVRDTLHRELDKLLDSYAAGAPLWLNYMNEVTDDSGRVRVEIWIKDVLR